VWIKARLILKGERRRRYFVFTLMAACAFFADGRELAEYSEFAMFDGGRENETRYRVAVGKQRLDESFEIGEVGCGHFEQEVIAAGEVVAFANFFEGLDELEETVVILPTATHANEGEHVEAEGFAIDFEGVAAQDAGLLHLLEPFGGRGGGEADAAAKFGEAEAGICLQLMD
jgi:hypothetical protein